MMCDISDVRVSSNVYTSDYSIEGLGMFGYPSTGGIVGRLDGSSVKCNNTLIVGCSASRGFSGGYFGFANDSTLGFKSCGSVGGVAAKYYAGGYIGKASSCNADFVDCYSACEYDTISFDTIIASD